MKLRLAVVGGGITGLATAWYLQAGGAEVTVFDAAPTFGGLSVAATFGDFTWDRFYHVIAPQDQRLVALLSELGLGDQLRWARTRQGVFLDGAVRALNSPLDLLRLPTLTLLDKFRLGLLALRGGRVAVTPELDRATSADWLRARCGDRAFDRLWRHLLRAKLGDAAERVSARFIHATLQRLLAARAAGGGDRFGYVHGGYAAVLDRFVDRLTANGVTLRAATAVLSVRSTANGVAVTLASGSESFDHVVATTPNPVLANLLPDLPVAEAARLRATEYLGVLCTVVVGRTPLSANYILNLCDDRLRITGVIETTNVVDRSETGGHCLVYLPRYAVATSPLFAQSDAEVAAAALADLRVVFPAADERWLLHQSVHRARFIQPIPIAGAPPCAPPRQVVPGRITVVNNAQLPGCVLNNDDCVGLAKAAAAAILGPR